MIPSEHRYMMTKFKESDLYSPIKTFLVNLGYEVKGEIKNCDIVALKEDSVIIIELKLTLNITLLLQAVERFTLADTVYIAIPTHCTVYKKQRSRVKKLIARLGLGLIIVDMHKENHYVEVVHDPKDYTPRKNRSKQNGLLKEFSTRQGDPEKGGTTRRRAGLTAYRQRSIRIAAYLAERPTAKGAQVKTAIDEPQATNMLNKNYYGWFNKVTRGVYKISEKGCQELPQWQKKMQKITQQP